MRYNPNLAAYYAQNVPQQNPIADMVRANYAIPASAYGPTTPQQTVDAASEIAKRYAVPKSAYKTPKMKYTKPPQTTATGTPNATAGAGGLKGAFSGLSGTLGNAWNNVKSGKGIMPKYAKYANIAAGINTAATAARGISQYSNAVADTEDLVSQILASAGSNPNLRYDLSADQMQLLRQLQNGTYDTSAGFSIDGLLNNLGNVATGAGMGFLTGGGWTGALMGALAPAAEGITSGMSADQGRITAELEGLYNALLDSEMTTKDMKRNANMQRYANSIYGY